MASNRPRAAAAAAPTGQSGAAGPRSSQGTGRRAAAVVPVSPPRRDERAPVSGVKAGGPTASFCLVGGGGGSLAAPSEPSLTGQDPCPPFPGSFPQGSAPRRCRAGGGRGVTVGGDYWDCLVSRTGG